MLANRKVKLFVALAVIACAVLMLAPAGAQQLYVSGSYLSNVYRYNADGTSAPAPGQSNMLFTNVGGAWNGEGMAMDDSYLYVARNGSMNVRRYDRVTGVEDTSWGVNLPDPSGQGYGPSELQFAPNGYLYTMSYKSSQEIYKIDVAAQTSSIVLTGAYQPYCMDFDAQGRAYITDYWYGRVLRYNEVAGSWVKDTTFNAALPMKPDDSGVYPSHGVAVDDLGRVYASTYWTDQVFRFDSSGVLDETWQATISGNGRGYNIAIGPDNTPYITNGWSVFKLDPNDAANVSVFATRPTAEYGANAAMEHLYWDLTAVPEPGSLLALGAGLVSVLGLCRRRR